MRLIGKIIEKAELLCLAGSCLALVLIMLLTTADVVLRKLADSGIAGVYGVTEDYLMVAIVFLSISHVYRSGGHIRVTLFEKTIPHILRPFLNLFKNLTALVFFGIIAIMGWKTAMSALSFGEVSSGALIYPIAPALFIVPLGAGLTCLRIIQELSDIFGSFKNELKCGRSRPF